MTDSAAPPIRRAVLIGASNLSRDLPLVVALLSRGGATPIDILLAAGRGRSFGQESLFLGRRLPGIEGCGLWGKLRQRDPIGESRALVTDIGNDLLYGASVDAIAAWVQVCLERIAAAGIRDVVVSGLPLASIERLSRVTFGIARTLLFPMSRLTLREALARSRDLSDRVERSATITGARFVRPSGEWFGLDPIHFRRGQRPAVWSALLEQGPPPIGPVARIGRPRAERRSILGIEQRTPQPSLRLDGGTTIAAY